MEWNGKALTGSAKSSVSQFACLMQILLHHREKGIEREQVEEYLFSDRDLENPHHAMQSVIYNAKKRLKAAGLPDVNYIEQKKGVFCWTDRITVEEDAAEFEGLYRQAVQEEEGDRKLSLYLEACHRYTGEFLPAQTGAIWVAQEAKRYREIFCTCVEEAVNLLREHQDYFQMEALGIYAAGINPLADWEIVTMEALESMGRYEDARKLYDDTVEYYLQEQGLRPSKKLLEHLDRLGMQMEHHHEVLDAIQAKLSQENGNETGGYLCPYPVFRGIYHMVERLMERGGQSVFLMLCTVVDGKGNPMKDGPMLEELSQRMCESIRLAVRRGDVLSKYGRGQYLVLLINITRENCKIVQKRINYRFIVGHQRTGIQYYVNSVFCTPNWKDR